MKTNHSFPTEHVRKRSIFHLLKITLISTVILIALPSCNEYSSLFRLIDKYIILASERSAKEDETLTLDGKYRVSHLSNSAVVTVEIDDDASPSTKHYEILRQEIENHYADNPKVEEVYITIGGFIGIYVY